MMKPRSFYATFVPPLEDADKSADKAAALASHEELSSKLFGRGAEGFLSWVSPAVWQIQPHSLLAHPHP